MTRATKQSSFFKQLNIYMGYNQIKDNCNASRQYNVCNKYFAIIPSSSPVQIGQSRWAPLWMATTGFEVKLVNEFSIIEKHF